MKVFEKHFNKKVSLNFIDKYIRSVISKIDPEDEISVLYKDQKKGQFVRIKVLN